MNCDQKSDLESGCDTHVKPMQRVEELMDVNKLWKQEYDLLQRRYQHDTGQLQEENQKLKQEVRRSELRCSILETKNVTLQGELGRLARTLETVYPQCCRASKEISKEPEDVELIREQLDVFREDFKLEHEDKEKIQSEKASLQERLLQCEKLVHSLNKELDLYKTECKRLHDERGRQNCERRHSSLDRSNSYPSTSSLSCTEVPFHSVSNMAMLPPSLGGNKNKFVHLEEFRYEQLKRGILVRNPSQTRPPPPERERLVTRRLSDSSSHRSTDQSDPSSADQSSPRLSCFW